MGDGMIEAHQWFPTPLRPQLPLAADLNGDGIVDVAVPGRVGRSFSTCPSVMWTGTDMQGRTVAAGIYHVCLRQGSSTQTASVLRLD